VVIQTHVEDAEPEPRTVTESKPADTLVYPALLGRAKREAQGLDRLKVTSSAREAVVTLSKEDTDYQIVYRFEFDSCWRLVRVDDQSL
jgi:hypothetical protein